MRYQLRAIRQLLFIFTSSGISLLAQGAAATPKNLQILKPEEIRTAMGAATVGLGVQCTECHVTDRSSDEKPTKLIARKMFAMTQEINNRFPDGKAHVSCYTCHRGQKEPLMAPPPAAQ